MTEQDIKPEVKKPKVDQMLLFAMEIAVGKAEVTVTYCLEEDKFYEYKNGVWQHINEFDLLSYACMNLEKINKHTIASKKQILENLKVIKNIKLEKFNQNSLINLENGMFSPEDLAIFPHDEKYYSTMRIPYKYDYEAKCELWLKTLNEILEGDKHKINILQEFFGYCLTKDTRQHKALLLTGESRCLGGETLIYDPIKNTSIPVSEIKEDFHVEAWDGNKIVIARAEKPFTKEIDDLYEVTLSNGNSFVCSMSHLILTKNGYFPLRELPVGCEVFLPSTNLDNDPSNHVQDAQHCSKKVQDCSVGYHLLSRFCGEQPHVEEGIFQSFSPLQVDVQQHIYSEASLRKDDLENKQVYSHLGQPNVLPSTSDVPSQHGLALLNNSNCISSLICELGAYLRRVVWQPMIEIFPQKTILESSSSGSCFFLPYNPPCLVITSIVYKREDVKYDFTVPIYHNYICGGAVHHNSGKSTILQTLRSVVGDKNCSSVPLKYISNPQYTPMLINKLVNLDTDVSAKAAEFEAEFKTITSGEPVSCNQKFIAAFEFQPCCKVVMAANIFPKITDHSSAFYKRLILIPCDRVFSDEEQNKNLLSELRVELPGILNWSAQGLKRLRERGRFEDLEFMREAVKELEDENNPVNIFFEEHIVVDLSGNKYIEKSNLYELYKKWCFETNNFTLSKARFASCVFKTYSKSTPKDSRLNNNGSRVWKNLSYIDNKNQQGQPISWQD